MKFFQKRGVAIVVLILAIVASSAWGLHKSPGFFWLVRKKYAKKRRWVRNSASRLKNKSFCCAYCQYTLWCI